MRFKIACIQLNSSSDLSSNIAAITEGVIKAKESRANLVCLPEYCFLMPDSSKTLRNSADFMNKHKGVKSILDLAENLGIEIIIGSVPINIMGSNKLRNRSIYIGSSGEILAYYDKVHLFNSQLGDISYNESRTFEHGDKSKVYWTKFGKIGLSICYDIRFPYLYRTMAQKGAEFLNIPSAFPAETGDLHWHVLCRARAIENSAYVFAPAQVGKHSKGNRSYGHSLIISPYGQILAEASGTKPDIIFADVSSEEVSKARKIFNNLGKDKIAKQNIHTKQKGLLNIFSKHHH